MATLILAEHDNIKLKESTNKAVTAANLIGDTIDILVVGNDCMSVATQASKVTHASKVIIVEESYYQNMLAEPVSDLIVSLMKDYKTLMSPATTNGKNILPRVAATLDVSQISEITAVIDKNTFERPIYAGNAIATIRTTTEKNVITVRTTAFDAATNENNTEIEILNATANPCLSEFIEEKISGSERPELTSAS